MKRMWSRNELKQQADARVQALVEGGTLDNAKPIYCHPLEIYASGKGVLTALIFNNSSTPLDTWAKLISAIKSFNPNGECRLLVTGALADADNSKLVIGSEIYINNLVENAPVVLIGVATDGTIYTAGSAFDIKAFEFSVQDDVNKIN